MSLLDDLSFYLSIYLQLVLCARLMESYVWRLLKLTEKYVNSQISIDFQTNINTWFWSENLVLILSSFFFCAGKS